MSLSPGKAGSGGGRRRISSAARKSPLPAAASVPAPDSDRATRYDGKAAPKEMRSMHPRSLIAAIALMAALFPSRPGAQAFDDQIYPDWKGQWIGGWTQRFPGVTGQPSYDPRKSDGRGELAPLTPEYQAV